MNLSNSREFLILNKYKEFINILDNLIENIPKKDYFYKDKLKDLSIKLLYFINKVIMKIIIKIYLYIKLK